ncbi:hypothetical protein V6B14_13770 [Sporosarcina psychrophila]|uniref:hypothetical protein n=1 Tax=Sporosarcina psychrophila TaxID=1476 RepID=UPI0030D05BED
MNDHQTITEEDVQECGEVAFLYIKIAQLYKEVVQFNASQKQLYTERLVVN